MEQPKLKIAKEGAEALSVLAELRDPYAALLYAYLAGKPGGCTLQQAVQALNYTEEQGKRASELLLVYGLACDRTLPPMHDSALTPTADLAEAREGDPAFSGLCDYFEAAKGGFLNRRELETLLNVYQALAFPPEVLTLLIGDCAGRGRLSAREVEKQAYRWYDAGLTTFESASAYLERCRQRMTRSAHILDLLGVGNHQAGVSEQKYIDAWEEMGVTDELLRLAYDRTLLGAHRLSWPYLHKILVSWNKLGLKTAEQVDKYERSGKRAPVPETQPKESVETVVLRRMQEKRQKRALELESRREELRRSAPAFAENESALRLCASKLARAKPSEKAALALQYQNCIEQQNAILLELGKPEDWLTDKPDCPICGDRGYVGTQKCRCLLRACEEEEKARA